MDWNRPNRLLRPNPDWEEDLFLTCEVTPPTQERVESYTAEFKKRQPKKDCICKSWNKPGVAPRLTLNNFLTIPCMGIGTWLGFDSEAVEPRWNQHPVGSNMNERARPGWYCCRLTEIRHKIAILVSKVVDFSMQCALETAIEKGYRLIDTAPSYKTEFMVGRAVHNKIQEHVVCREDMYIVTKLPNDCHGEKAVVPALRKSLREMDLDYVDLYLIHWPIGFRADGSYDTTDYVDTWKGMEEARVEGLTKAIGVSNFNQSQLERLNAMAKIRPAVLQIEVNLNLQQAPLIDYCCRNNIIVMGYSPFGSLFPSTARNDAPEPRSNNRELLDIAVKHQKTVPQIVIRYLIELGVVPIPKAVTPGHIENNIQVFDFELSKKERQVLASFDRKYRTMPVTFWKDAPFYPFET